METLAQQEFKKDNINLNEEIIKEIYDLKGNAIEFESENNNKYNKYYTVKYLDKKLEFPMDNSPVICIFDSEREIEIHLLKLLNTDPRIIKDDMSYPKIL